MNIKEALKNKTPIPVLTAHILENPETFSELMKCFLVEKYRLNQYASNIILKVSLKNSSLIKPYTQKVINKLGEDGIHDALKRNAMRIWEEAELEPKYYDQIYTIAFSYLEGKEAIAIKAFAMKVCYRIAEEIPELKPELKFVIETNILKYGELSPGIKSRGKKILGLLA